MLAIISVTVEQYYRNSQVLYVWPYKFMSCVLEHNAHVHTQPEPLLPWSVFKTKQNEMMRMFFWSIFGHVRLLKLEMDVEDEHRYSVLQIDIVSSKKYCD